MNGDDSQRYTWDLEDVVAAAIRWIHTNTHVYHVDDDCAVPELGEFVDAVRRFERKFPGIASGLLSEDNLYNRGW